MFEVSEEENFCRVFELPSRYPDDYCFNGPIACTMLLVDWFNPVPSNIPYETWEDCKQSIIKFIQTKEYVKLNKKYLVITDFNTSFILSK
jgi:hypothetical protein